MIWICPTCKWTTEQPDTVIEMAHLCGKGRRHSSLKRLDAPVVNIRAAIVAEATARFPEEACGFILSTGTVVMAKNIAQDPANNFMLDPAVGELWWPTGKVSGVWHSHCFDSAVPSERDESLAQPGLECWIYSVMDEQLGIYKPDKNGKLQLLGMEDLHDG